MYDRASRNLSQPGNTTIETVGPGSYELPNFLRGRTRVGYAPFGSMTGRETFFDVSDQTMAAPGPGQYDPLLKNLDRVKGGQSLANKSKRFNASCEEIPGPGRYNISKNSDWIKEQPQKPITQEERSVGKHIVFLHKVDPPSIPSPGKSYGYEEANDGSLKPQKMPDQDFSMGPAYYNVDHRDTQTTRNYKGNFFGKKDSKRYNFRGKGHGPGPGAYDPFEPQDVKAPIDFILEENNKRFFEAKIPRYHELVAKEQEKKAVPAPGHYEIKSQFQHKTAVPESDHTALVAPFGSQARRFDGSSNSFPAPGTYDDPRTAFETLRRIKGIKGSPFGQTSIRFYGNQRNKSLPGPGSYDVPDEISTMIRKNIMAGSKKKAAFGSSSVRTVPLTRNQEHLYPGPAHYTNMEPPPRQDVQLSSTFASVTERVHSPPPIVREIPPPGSYEVRKSYDTTQVATEIHNKLQKQKWEGRVLYSYSQKNNRNSKKRGAFLSSSSRFKDNVDGSKRGTTPGPGQYEILAKHPAQGGLMVTKDTRFKPQKSEVPGPGNYELSPQFAHSVLRGTFNATLNNPMTKTTYEDKTQKLSPSKQEITLTSK